jgi:hypothetical protein
MNILLIIMSKYTCVCGSYILLSSKRIHITSKKHKSYIINERQLCFMNNFNNRTIPWLPIELVNIIIRYNQQPTPTAMLIKELQFNYRYNTTLDTRILVIFNKYNRYRYHVYWLSSDNISIYNNIYGLMAELLNMEELVIQSFVDNNLITGDSLFRLQLSNISRYTDINI